MTLPPILPPCFTLALPPLLAWLLQKYFPPFRRARLFWLTIGVWFLSLLPACSLVIEAVIVAAMEGQERPFVAASLMPLAGGGVRLPYAPGISWQTQGFHGFDNWEGRDYKAGCGMPLYAPLTGTVTGRGFDGFVGPHGRNNSYIKFDDGQGTEVVLLHGEYSARVGEQVFAGHTKIGTEASVGNSSGCHTHFTLRVGGQAVDPAKYLE